MKIGEPFNPWKLFQGAFIPNWLLMRPDVSPGAKLCYARLMQYAGRNGECFPRQDVLADELGVHKRQVQRYVVELTEAKLIQVMQPGLQKPNTYLFLCHAWMSAKADSDAPPLTTLEAPNLATQETAELSGVGGVPIILLRESVQENHSECSNLKKEKEKKSTELYSLYPRKVGRAGALKAIGRALGKVPFLELKAKVQAFAAAWVGANRDEFQYCPHPQTWFNDERYLEDPKEWERRKRNGKGEVPIHKQIEAMEESLSKNRCNHNSTYYDPARQTPEQLAEYKQIKGKLAELRKQQSQAILAS